MKTLLQKAALFVLILLAIKMPFVYLYEDEPTFRKREFSKQDFNAVMIGSSRTKLGLLPAYFDSLTESRTKTYNFGTNGGLPPDTFDWAEDLINTKHSLGYVFFELAGDEGIVQIHDEPWRSLRLTDYQRALQRLSLIEILDYHDKTAVRLVKPNLPRAFPDNNIALEQSLVNRNLSEKAAASPENLRTAQRRNLEVERTIQSAPADPKEKYRERIENLIRVAESKNVRLYFFIPPRIEAESEMKTLQFIWQTLDEKHKLRANHFEDALYADENSVDDFHLNHAGAMKFTENMAEAFKRLEQ